jgi:hypothetical protein
MKIRIHYFTNVINQEDDGKAYREKFSLMKFFCAHHFQQIDKQLASKSIKDHHSIKLQWRDEDPCQ